MHVICSRQDLNNAISMVQRAIATRSTRPILEGILFNADKNLTLTGYDMETGIETKVPADIREKGSLVLKAKIFGDIVRKLPEENVIIKADDTMKVSIESGQAYFEISAQSAEDYPAIPVVEEKQKLLIPPVLLKSMIEGTIFAASSDEGRPVLNGIKVQSEEDEIELVAIDGFRLAVRRDRHGSLNDSLNFIVPSKAMTEVARSLNNDEEENIAIFPSHNHILFESENFRLVSRLIEGSFIDYQRIIPPSCTSRIRVSTKDILNAMDRSCLIMDVQQKRFPVSLQSRGEGELHISAKTEVGIVEELIPIQLEGEAISIDFNPKYFLDALSVIEDEIIYMEFSGESAPCLIKPLEGDKFLYMLLPLRR